MSEQVWFAPFQPLNAVRMTWFRFRIRSISMRLFRFRRMRHLGAAPLGEVPGWVAKQYSEQKSPEYGPSLIRFMGILQDRQRVGM